MFFYCNSSVYFENLVQCNKPFRDFNNFVINGKIKMLTFSGITSK